MELGLCSWAVDRSDPVRAIHLAAEVGVRRVQLGFFGEQAVRFAKAKTIAETARQNGIELCGVFVAFDGEDYSSIESIARTGGFMPDDSFPNRMQLTLEAGDLVNAMNRTTLAVHVGTISVDSHSPEFRTLVSRVREVADGLVAKNVKLLVETGRESSGTLIEFLAAVESSNIGVNFDPANFVVYGTDDPVSAFSNLRSRIELVHLKDAARSSKPGVEWGRRTALGAGDTQIPRILSKLRAAGYSGPLLVESTGQSEDTTSLDSLRNALRYLHSMI